MRAAREYVGTAIVMLALCCSASLQSAFGQTQMSNQKPSTRSPQDRKIRPRYDSTFNRVRGTRSPIETTHHTTTVLPLRTTVFYTTLPGQPPISHSSYVGSDTTLSTSDRPAEESGKASAGGANLERISDGAAPSTLTMNEGSMLIAHSKPVKLRLPEGTLQIAPNAVVFAIRVNNKSAVFNLNDSHSGDVRFIGDDDTSVNIAMGHQLVMSPDRNIDFKEANPAKFVCENAKKLEGISAISIFAAEFSPLSALVNIPQFNSLIRSKRKDDVRLANRILKTAAILNRQRLAAKATTSSTDN